MQGTMLYGPGDIRYEEIESPTILHPTDAIVRLAVSSMCSSDLWPYRGERFIRFTDYISQPGLRPCSGCPTAGGQNDSSTKRLTGIRQRSE